MGSGSILTITGPNWLLLRIGRGLFPEPRGKRLAGFIRTADGCLQSFAKPTMVRSLSAGTVGPRSIHRALSCDVSGAAETIALRRSWVRLPETDSHPARRKRCRGDQSEIFLNLRVRNCGRIFLGWFA